MSLKKSTKTVLFGLLSLCIFDYIEASAQRVTRDDEWVFSASNGVPVWIAFNDASDSPMAGHRSIFVYIEGQNFTPDNIRRLFTNLATQYKQPDWLYITAFSDKRMLQRAINTRTSGVHIHWADTPEGREAAKKWAEEHEPLPSGYHRARYRRIPRDYYGQKYFEEEYSYSPDPSKSEMITVVLQGKPNLSPYSGNLNSDLLIAAKEGDADKVAALLAKGANVNSRDEDGDTALMIATLSAREMNTVKALLAGGADVNAKNKENDTAMIYAAADDDPEILKALLDKGADINHQNNNGYSPLIMASVNELRLPNARFLLAHGADLSLKNDDGETALIMAVNGSVIELIKALLEKGASVNEKDNDGNTALTKASGPRQPEIVRLLVEGGADVNTRNALGETPLMTAFSKEATRILLARGADVNAKNNDGDTSLIYAARSADAERAKLLLERGAKLQAKNKKGETALGIANGTYGISGALLDVLEGAEAKLAEAGSISGSTGPPQLVVKRDPLAQCCEEVSSVAFSPDGKMVASKLYGSAFASNQSVILWDAATGKLIKSIEGPARGVIDVQFSPDSQEIASIYGQIWNIETGKLARKIAGPNGSSEESGLFSFAFSPKRRVVAFSGKRMGERNNVTLQDVATGQAIRSLSTDAPVIALRFSADGNTLAGVVRSEECIAMWDAITGEAIRKVKAPGDVFEEFAVSGDAKLIAVGSGPFAQRNDIDILEATSGKTVHHLEGHSTWVSKLAFSPDAKFLASGSSDSTVKIWSLATGRLIYTLPGHKVLVRSVVFNPDGRLLVSGGGQNETKVWSVGSGKLLVTLVAFNDGNWIAYTPDGYYNCSEGASKYLAWRVANRVLEDPKYDAQFLRPEIVAERLRD